jgi:DNA-binding NtrC family response regulator
MKAEMFPAQPILLVDDDHDLQRSYGYALRQNGVNNLIECMDSREVERILTKEDCAAVVLDLNMPHVSGRELLPAMTRQRPDMPVIVVTGVDDVPTAVQCMKEGAFDYVVKPVDESHLLTAIRRALDAREIRRENSLLKEHMLSGQLRHPDAFSEIVTANKTMLARFQYVEAVAQTQQPILITGETGVGKELVAKAIHMLSHRRGSFVPVNIAGLDDNVFSDTLFGHMKGAFTGASEMRRGLIEQAADGTLFLDEIGELSPASQIKLLRLLQEREYLPLGADVPKRTNARIVVATNRRLDELKDSASFRADLFYRLRSHHVDIPPLRERLDDLPLLVDHFLAKAAKALGKRKPTPPRELFSCLRAYSFPGNVRELEGMVFNAVSTHRSGILSLDSFKSVISGVRSSGSRRKPAPKAGGGLVCSPTEPLPTLKEAGSILISEALRRTDGNQTLAAELLGITRQTLNRHLRLKAE